ncbi:MAG TPA: DinB family protein, partial [Thermoanaerobaculia bacterium]|nr:DinB family protein [Thermoanaerobaculia bacterium]
IIGCLRGLTDEQFRRAIPSSFPSIRETLEHVIQAEWIWLRRWKGESPTSLPEWADLPTLHAAEVQLRAIERERRALLDALTSDALQGEVAYRSFKGDPFVTRLDHQMQHVANHSSYHRGQLTTMIRQVGRTPPTTDLIFWYRNRE